MKLEAQIDALERLAAIDAELGVLEEQLSKDRTVFDGKKSHLVELEGRLETSETSVKEMERTRGEIIQELRQMSVQIDKSREKLSRVRSEREANAVTRELEELRKLYRDREIEIEKLTGLADQAKGEIETTRAQRDELSAEVGDSEDAVTSRLGAAAELVAGKQAERAAVVNELPVVLYRRYEMVRKRRGTAIAFTVEGTCSACNIMLPPMFFQTLKRQEELSQCPSCNRILYFRRNNGESVTVSDAQDTPSGGP